MRTTHARPLALLATLALFGAACGSSGGDGESDGDTGGAAEVATDVGVENSGDSTEVDGQGQSEATAAVSGDAELSTAPIPFRDLYDFRTGEEPVARTEVVQLDQCPLLSLATLEASSGTYSDPTTIGEATAQRCSFNNGPAFSFTVEAESAADVDVDDHSGRAYNIDVEPIVEPQSGPGEKAVILVDTAFVDSDDDEGFRYLYFFVLGDQAVTLRSTAFKVRDDGWRALADEVAANLSSGAAGGEVETVEVIDEVAPYSIEPCDFVAIEQLAALSGFDASSITAEHELDRFMCRWTHPEQGGVSFRFGAAERLYSEAVGNGIEDRSADLGILAAGSPVFYDVWLLDDDVRGFTVNADSEGWYSSADAVAVNLFERIEKPEPF